MQNPIKIKSKVAWEILQDALHRYIFESRVNLGFVESEKLNERKIMAG